MDRREDVREDLQNTRPLWDLQKITMWRLTKAHGLFRLLLQEDGHRLQGRTQRHIHTLKRHDCCFDRRQNTFLELKKAA